MIKLVVDASVTVKWFIRDSNKEKDVISAVDILKGIGENTIALIQPPHWMAETTAVLARLQPDLTDDAIDLLDALEIPIGAQSSVYKQASYLARKLNYHLFDTLYHALALQENATLITADHRYFRKAVERGSICLLADFDIETLKMGSGSINR